GAARRQTPARPRQRREGASPAATRCRSGAHPCLPGALGTSPGQPQGPAFPALRGLTERGGITASGIYRLVDAYAKRAGIEVAGLGVHGLRAIAATMPWSM